ncbi:hypothetical protein ACGFIP_32165 [Micromonospora zamorensis]|uniref:hypothetical protein n=1 Tax=Micromonospora zamorensis TaxID=709883 RepID=UPI003720A21D
MKDADPYTFVSALIGALFAGGIAGGLIMGMALRVKMLDEGDRAGAAYRDLRDAARRYADPAKLAPLMRAAADIWDRWRPDGLHMDAFYRRDAATELAPAYVHRIIDAYDTGDKLDLSGCWVPPDVEGRLRVIRFGASPPMAWPTAVDRWPTQRGPSDV